MRSALFMAVLLAIGVLAVGQDRKCDPRLTHVLGLTRESRTVSIALATPLQEILKALGKLDPKVGGSISLAFTTTTLMSGWRATCPPNCCPAYIDVSLYASHISWSSGVDPFNAYLQLQHSGHLVPEKEEKSAWKDDRTGECHAEHTIYGGVLSSSLTLGVRVGVGPLSIGYGVSRWEAEVWSSVVPSCRAGDADRRSANNPPTLYGPHYFTIPKGGPNELVLIAVDKDGADDISMFSIVKLPAGVTAVQGKVATINPNTRAATFYLSTDAVLDPCRPTPEKRCEKPYEAYLEVEVVDSYRKSATLRIPVTSQASPPQLELEHSGFQNGEYWVWFKITDRDLGDRFVVEVEKVVGGKITFVPERELWCDVVYSIPCETRFLVIFAPSEDSSERYFEVKVIDRYGLSASQRWSNPKGLINGPPVVSIWPPEHRALSGQHVEADVVATDPQWGYDHPDPDLWPGYVVP